MRPNIEKGHTANSLDTKFPSRVRELIRDSRDFVERKKGMTPGRRGDIILLESDAAARFMSYIELEKAPASPKKGWCRRVGESEYTTLLFLARTRGTRNAGVHRCDSRFLVSSRIRGLCHLSFFPANSRSKYFRATDGRTRCKR